jgi:ABC transporter substrate-binding protein (ThiB subfamily)
MTDTEKKKHSPLDKIVYISIPEDSKQVIDGFTMEPKILIPVEIPENSESWTLENLSWEMIVSAMLKIFAYDPTHKDISYYRDFINVVQPNLVAELTKTGVIKAEAKEFALAEEIFTPYDSPALKSIDADLIFDKTLHVLPFDYGFFSIIYDSQTISTPPTSLEDLTAPEYAKKLIIMDPRTSSPGLGFLLWTIAVYGDSYPEYWERLKPSLLTVTDGWDTGYGLFTNGEAPMVLSYTTSPAYHVEYEDTTRYLAAMFPEGHYLQIEGAGIVNGAEHADLARLFIDYLLGEDAQRVIPLTNWMYPTNSTIELPKSYEYAPRPEHMLTMSSSTITDSLDDWLKTLTNIMSR